MFAKLRRKENQEMVIYGISMYKGKKTKYSKDKLQRDNAELKLSQ